MASGQRWRWHEIAVLLGLTPFLWSTFMHVAAAPKPQTIAPPVRPALAFDQYLVDMGKTPPTTEVRGTFFFENRSSRPVVIDKVDPSCGCLQPVVSSHQIPPGDTGSIILRMQPANETPGRKTYYADIHYHDPDPRQVRITFRVEVPERHLSVRPRALTVYQLSLDQPTTHTIRVNDLRDTPAEIRSAMVNSPFVDVSIETLPEREADGTIAIVHVRVSPELPPGRKEAIITLQTSDPESPILRIPVRLEGNSNQKT
jgi:hypothetical protein